MAALNLPFLLLGPESAPSLAEVEAALRCSVLGLLTGGLAAYVDDAELLSSSMIAVRHAVTLATLQPWPGCNPSQAATTLARLQPCVLGPQPAPHAARNQPCHQPCN